MTWKCFSWIFHQTYRIICHVTVSEFDLGLLKQNTSELRENPFASGEILSVLCSVQWCFG